MHVGGDGPLFETATRERSVLREGGREGGREDGLISVCGYGREVGREGGREGEGLLGMCPPGVGIVFSPCCCSPGLRAGQSAPVCDKASD